MIDQRMSKREAVQRVVCEVLAEALGLRFDPTEQDETATLQRRRDRNDAPVTEAGGVPQVWAVVTFGDGSILDGGDGESHGQTTFREPVTVDLFLSATPPEVDGVPRGIQEWTNTLQATLESVLDLRPMLAAVPHGLTCVDMRSSFGPYLESNDGDRTAGIEFEIQRRNPLGEPWVTEPA